MVRYSLRDRSGNVITYIDSSRELFALIRHMRRLRRDADEHFEVVAYEEDGAPHVYRPEEVLGPANP